MLRLADWPGLALTLRGTRPSRLDTLEQAIHAAFLAAVNARPEVLTEDAGVIIMAALTACGLANFESKLGVYERKR